MINERLLVMVGMVLVAILDWMTGRILGLNYKRVFGLYD